MIICHFQSKSKFNFKKRIKKLNFFQLQISYIKSTKNDCCVDYKAAFLVEADLIVKFGFSCMFDSKNNIDILYCFNKSQKNINI